MRRLGGLTFILIRDSFSDIQAVASGKLGEALKSERCPFYVTISGVLRERPQRDARPDSINGLVEIGVEALHVHPHAGLHMPDATAANALKLVSFLQSRGFFDVRSLAAGLAPSFVDLVAGEPAEAADAARHLAQMLGPCRWHLLTRGRLVFGLAPGFVTDLQECLGADQLPLGAAGREIIEGACWHQERLDSMDRPPMAYGEIPLGLPAREAGSPAATSYWRNRYKVAHLSDATLVGATVLPKFDDVAVRSLVESVERSQVVMASMAGARSAGDIAPILRDFPEFDLHAEHIEGMLSLFPSLEKRLVHLERERQFELLWSILGHDHVRAIFASPEAVERLSSGVRAGLFADFNVMRHLDRTALASIAALSHDFTSGEAIEIIGRLFAIMPASAASACFLMGKVDQAGLQWQRCMAVAEHGHTSELPFFAAALGAVSPAEIKSWRDALTSQLERIFTNDPVDEAACRAALLTLGARHPWISIAFAACPDLDVVFEAINLVYGSGLVPYEEAARMYREAADCSRHWMEAGIVFGGNRWQGAEGRYRLVGLDMYPSKNRAAILAKSCSGICSARNTELFHRPDHFQFTLVESAGHAAAGSVQLYTHLDESGRPIWVLRGLNPSERIVVEPVGFTIEVLDTLASMARHNGVVALVCGDGCGLFNADSARLPIRAVMRRLATQTKRVDFDRPLHLFDHHDRSISIDFGWQVWP
jgi:hypothetical protein